MPYGSSFTAVPKTVLVTGANSGIGYELVRLLARQGHTVYLGARNPKAGGEARDKLNAEGLHQVKSVLLDVTNSESVAAAKESIEKAEGRLDVLVDNAVISEVFQCQNSTTVSLSLTRSIFEPNFFVLMQTTIAFLPLLRASLQATILNVSTDMPSNTYQARPESAFHFAAYNASKAAANSYTITLAHELKSEGIKVNAVTPGYTATRMNRFAPGAKSAREAAEILLPWALLDKDGPTGLFIGEHGKEFP